LASGNLSNICSASSRAEMILYVKLYFLTVATKLSMI